ncbi:Uncharacterized protein DUF547 [Olavius sp. associated proteobacterium Delta 1]|nr:Uncharacterized protein DUF547 [Olavius sp. associated proteobacterium Delta 1]
MKIKQLLAAAVFAFLITVVLIEIPLLASTGSSVSHSLFGDLLHKYVADGNVNYAGFQSEEDKLDQYLDLLQSVDPKTLSRKEQFAFYANVYNAWTIKLILTKYPAIDSIKELGIFNTGPWKKKVVRLSGETVSLDHIEHDILRPRFRDPRVHFAINCAAKSCPPLRPEPYLAEKLDQQLDDATRSFINNPNNYRLEGRNLHVSRIFKWFSEDFNEDALGFFIKYANEALKKKLQTKPEKINIKYLAYDWSLNGK